MGEASVIGVNQLKETVIVQLESEATVELPVAEINPKKRQGNEINPKRRQGKEKRGRREPKASSPE